MLLLSGCSKDPGGSLITESLPSRLTPEECKIAIFENGSPEGFWSRNDRGNGPPFDCRFSSDNARIADGLLQLWLTAEETGYVGAEYHTWNTFHYGYYSVSMQAVKCDGVISSFFLYTGRPWDEIDIEFLGNDTTKVQFNYYHNGKGGHEYLYDLGFDASKEFHTYGYRWTETSITWFVDGQPVYKVTTDKSATPAKNLVIVDVLPSTPGRILTNYWCGNQDAEGWMGKYQGQTKDNGTQYKWIATSAAGAPLNPEEKPNEEITGIDWNGISPIAPTFASTEIYTVTTNGTASNITYTGVGGSSYINVEMDIAEAFADKNYVHLTVTNNGNEQVSVRVNMVDMALVEAGAQNMSTNIAATMDGTAVNTDAVWGGSFFDIPAGKTTELVIQFNGQVEKLQLMLDSSRNDANTYSGDITVDNIKFAKVGDIEIPEQPDDPVVPPVENPTSGDLTTTVDGVEVTWSGNVSDGYGLNADDASNTLRVTYTAIVGNSYKNFWATMTDIAATKNIFSMKVTNNGAAAVKIRIDIESKTQVNANTTACNLSATQDGVEVYTDLEWGGSSFTVEPGATAVLEVVYDAAKQPTNVKVFVDSAQYDDSTTHAGDITISEVCFKGEYTLGEGGDEPTDPPATEEPMLSYWTSSDAYTVNGNNIRYNGAGNTYACVGVPIADLAAGNNTFTVTITNNGTADTRVRFDIQATTQVGNHKVCNVSATGGDVWTDMEWGGSTVTVPAGQSVTLVITYDGNTERGAVADLVIFVDAARGDSETYNADITLSGMAFSNAGEENPEEPKPVEGEYLNFKGNDCYSFDCAADAYVNTVRVTYTDVSRNTYLNVNTWIQDKAAGKNQVSLQIKNNGTTTVVITVKVEDASATGLGEQTVTIAPGETVTVNLRYTGEASMLYFFIDTG
ncbi:MAG: glycosyl hydrolase family protein [Ruminococcaceae bacterium]|nr:glycosyl hydrolase family protein [Oscillospiraceae bacterium]